MFLPIDTVLIANKQNIENIDRNHINKGLIFTDDVENIQREIFELI